MGRRTITEKEKRIAREKKIKIIITLSVLALIASIAIFYVLNRDELSNDLKSGIMNWFTSSQDDENKDDTNNKNKGDEGMNQATRYSNVEKNPVVTMEMNDGGIVKIELYPKIAPTTVENFISLIESGFYDGLIFHRVMPDFMAQGGDPNGDGTGGPDYSIYGEFSANGFENNLSHEIGVISMARAQEMDSAGSQFFIVTNENSYLSLDGLYAGFGKVTEGMDIVYNIVKSETLRKDYSDELKAEIDAAGGEISTEELYLKYMKETTEITKPINPPTIKKMTVDTFGYEYAEPQKIK